MSNDSEKNLGQDMASTEIIKLQNIYFNGFQLSLSNSDVSAVLLLNNAPAGALSMSFTTAKSLSSMLSKVISHLEEATGKDIMDTETVTLALDQSSAGENH